MAKIIVPVWVVLTQNKLDINFFTMPDVLTYDNVTYRRSKIVYSPYKVSGRYDIEGWEYVNQSLSKTLFITYND